MHEMALTQSVVEIALEEARKAADALSAKRQESLVNDAHNLNQAISRLTRARDAVLTFFYKQRRTNALLQRYRHPLAKFSKFLILEGQVPPLRDSESNK